jgi:hypothetical protein
MAVASQFCVFVLGTFLATNSTPLLSFLFLRLCCVLYVSYHLLLVTRGYHYHHVSQSPYHSCRGWRRIGSATERHDYLRLLHSSSAKRREHSGQPAEAHDSHRTHIILGNYTTPNLGVKVAGIAAPNEFEGHAVNLLPYFTGGYASTNLGGPHGVAKNFLDDGGPVPLLISKPANGTNSNQ